MSRGKQKDQQLRDALTHNSALIRKVVLLETALEEILPILESIFDRGDESALRILRRARAALEAKKS